VLDLGELNAFLEHFGADLAVSDQALLEKLPLFLDYMYSQSN
jgi:hypothetical protein